MVPLVRFAPIDAGARAIGYSDRNHKLSCKGTGDNIPGFGMLRLAMDPGQNDFDYFCAGLEDYVGDVKTAAGT